MGALFFGLKCAVPVLVIEALLRIGRRALKGKPARVLWIPFMPCFAFVFLGAPMIERLQDNRALARGRWPAITAAVVGVIGNLAVWFGLRALFRAATSGWGMELPVPTSLDPAALAIAALAIAALAIAAPAGLCVIRFRLCVVRTLGVASVAGVVVGLPRIFA